MSPSSSRPRTSPFHGGNRGSNPLGDTFNANMSTSKINCDLLLKLNQTIQKVIDKQITDNEPPEVNTTISRLQKAGFANEKIRQMIGKLIAKHFQSLLQKQFSYTAYKEDLKKLPTSKDVKK